MSESDAGPSTPRDSDRHERLWLRWLLPLALLAIAALVLVVLISTKPVPSDESPKSSAHR